MARRPPFTNRLSQYGSVFIDAGRIDSTGEGPPSEWEPKREWNTAGGRPVKIDGGLIPAIPFGCGFGWDLWLVVNYKICVAALGLVQILGMNQVVFA